MIKAIIFDCFGVLFTNTQKIFFEKHQELFINGINILYELNKEIDLGRMTQLEFFKILEKEIGLPASQIQFEIEKECVADQQLATLIRKLKSNYKIGLLSNAAEDEINVVYKDKLETLFDSIIVSYQIGIAKPDPKIFQASIENLNVEFKDSLFIDDNQENVDMANKLGMQGFLYTDYDSFLKYLIKTGIIDN